MAYDRTDRADSCSLLESAAVFMVGLTGGIGAGKSTVAKMLVTRGAVVVDADAIARQVVEPGTATLSKLVERFGAAILRADETLDRAALARLGFASDDTRKDLEGITHPAIGAEFLRQVAAAPPDAVVVHDVPLLVESTRGFQYGCVIVVEAPLSVRLDRLEARGVPREDAERRIAAQASDEDRRQVATWIVDNGGDLEHLEAQIDGIWQEILARAREEQEQRARAEKGGQ